MRENFRQILKEIFYVFTAGLVIFSVLELAWERVVLSYINLNAVLLAWLIIGIVILMIDKNKIESI